jgi:hypothetical protein
VYSQFGKSTAAALNNAKITQIRGVGDRRIPRLLSRFKQMRRMREKRDKIK